MAANIIAYIDVCRDCMIARENDEKTTGREWQEMPDADVTPDFDVTTDYGYVEISSLKCEACGDSTDGERFQYAQWSEDSYLSCYCDSCIEDKY